MWFHNSWRPDDNLHALHNGTAVGAHAAGESQRAKTVQGHKASTGAFTRFSDPLYQRLTRFPTKVKRLRSARQQCPRNHQPGHLLQRGSDSSNLLLQPEAVFHPSDEESEPVRALHRQARSTMRPIAR